MNVALLTPGLGFQGGLELHVRDLALGLRERGHQVALFHGSETRSDPTGYACAFDGVYALSSDRLPPVEVLHAHKVHCRDFPQLVGKRVFRSVHDHDDTCLRRHRYLPIGQRACHAVPGLGCHTSGCSLAATLAQRRAREPVQLRRRLLDSSAHETLLPCSRYIADRLVDAGVPLDRVRVVNPIPRPLDAPPPVAPPGRQRLLVVAQLVHGKGVDLAINALRTLPHRLSIVGAGPARAELERAAHHVAPGRVEFLGELTRTQVTSAYDAADVVLVPSRWPEPFGMTGIEAFRRGRPVVVADHGGVRDWFASRCGVLVEPGSAAALAAGVERLSAHPHAWARALERAAHFSFERMVSDFEALYSGVSHELGTATATVGPC